MKLTINKIRELFAALSALDGYDKVVGDKIVKQPYDFSGKTKWNIAKNIKLLRNSLDTFDKVRDELIKEISGGKDTIGSEDKEKIELFNSKLGEILNQEEEVNGLLKFKYESFNLPKDENDKNGNQIPQTVLASLMDLVEE